MEGFKEVQNSNQPTSPRNSQHLVTEMCNFLQLASQPGFLFQAVEKISLLEKLIRKLYLWPLGKEGIACHSPLELCKRVP